MEFKNNEVICWIIPGIYIIVIFVSLFGLPENIVNDAKGTTIDVAVILVFALPIIGLIVGYSINLCASWLEWKLYALKKEGSWLGLNRSSYRILNNISNRTKLSNSSSVIEKLREKNSDLFPQEGNSIPNNIIAERSLLFAKEKINQESVNSYYYPCTFARNLCFAQLIAVIMMIISSISNSWTVPRIVFDGVSIVLLLLFYMGWRRKCDCYVRCCFTEFMKI